MNGLPEDIEWMVEFLGPNDPAVRRLLKAYARDPKLAPLVRLLLRRRCLRAGFDPNEPTVFCPVRNLPPGFVTMGQVVQGAMPGPRFALPPETLPQHVGVFGHNGTGKSFLAMHLALEAIRAGWRVWILDIEDEYSRLLPLLPDLVTLEPDQLRVNLFEPPGPWLMPTSWLQEVNLLLRGGTFLRDGSLNVFDKGMRTLLRDRGIMAGGSDWPSLREVVGYFQGVRFGPKTRNAGFVESLLNRLDMLCGAYDSMSSVAVSDMLPALAKRSVIFRLHGMTGIPLQFLAGFLLLWLARYREGAEDDAAHMVIIEEAHMLASEAQRWDIGETILSRMFRTARKRAISLVLCDQVPSGLPAAILGNLGCRFVMRLISAPCIRSLQSSMGLRHHQASAITELQGREAVVQYQLHPTPFMIKVPEMSFPGRPQDSDLRTRADNLVAGIPWREYAAAAGQPTMAALAPGDLAGDALQVMVRICEQPAEPIEQRCEALRMDRAREFRARGELDGGGLIEQADPTIGGRIKFFQPTTKGIAWAEKHRVRVKKFKSGIVHEYLLSQVERRIGLLGPKWRLQRNSSIAQDQGLQPDLLAMGPDGCRVIVEICCSNLAYDTENILIEAGIPEVDKVLAVAPDKRTTRALHEAMETGSASASPDQLAPVRLLDAGECLAKEFDWAGELLRPEPER